MNDCLTAEFVASIHWEHGPAPLSSHPELGPFTYFIQSGPFIKIGASAEPEMRVDQIRRGGKAKHPSAGIAADIRLLTYGLGGYIREAVLHERFADSNDRGEWFTRTDDLAAVINETAAAQARLEVEMHNAWYQRAVVTHGWPARSFDLDALTAKATRNIERSTAA